MRSRKTLSVDRTLADEFCVFAEKKHGFLKGALKAEVELALKKHIKGG